MTTQITPMKLARYPELLTGPARPIHWDVDPSSVCDHRCTGCPYIYDGAAEGKTDPMLGVVRPESSPNRRAFLEYDRFLAFLVEAKARGLKAITFVGGGEPTLHPHIVKMLQDTYIQNIKFGIVTHLGLKYLVDFFAVASRATWIRVSMNAATSETYLRHQGKDCFGQVIENIQKLSPRHTESPRVGVSFLITPDNYSEIPQAANLARDLGCAYIQFKPLITTEPHPLPLTTVGMTEPAGVFRQLRRAKAFASDTFQVLDQWDTRQAELAAHDRGEFSGPCHVSRFNPKLGANGMVYTCCELAYSVEGALGNIYDEPLAAILDRVDQKQMEMKTCPHCWDKPLNQIINAGRLTEVVPPPSSVDEEFV